MYLTCDLPFNSHSILFPRLPSVSRPPSYGSPYGTREGSFEVTPLFLPNQNHLLIPQDNDLHRIPNPNIPVSPFPRLTPAPLVFMKPRGKEGRMEGLLRGWGNEGKEGKEGWVARAFTSGWILVEASNRWCANKEDETECH